MAVMKPGSTLLIVFFQDWKNYWVLFSWGRVVDVISQCALWTLLQPWLTSAGAVTELLPQHFAGREYFHTGVCCVRTLRGLCHTICSTWLAVTPQILPLPVFFYPFGEKDLQRSHMGGEFLLISAAATAAATRTHTHTSGEFATAAGVGGGGWGENERYYLYTAEWWHLPLWHHAMFSAEIPPLCATLKTTIAVERLAV